ncbi:MAG: hypothetical protein GXO97_06235 [Nitrospirae bacterium]|nr:hypothetical protein [Nitrospirota bacterium]
MSKKDINKKKEQKRWIRPECVKVQLVPEEAVLWGCKLITGASAQNGWIGTCITLATCPSISS